MRTWQQERDTMLKKLWPQPLTRAEIARRVHLSVWSVWHHAKRLGLPPRTGNRDTTAACEYHRRKGRENQPKAARYACPACGYQSDDPAGHPHCRTEAVA